jgi:ZIP family zinc transporter
MLGAAAWALLAASSLILGAFVAQTFRVSDRRVGEAMAFGAGALIGALAYELVPNETLSDLAIWISFGAGSVVFYVLDGVIERRSAGGGTQGTAIALGALLDGIPESIVLGISLALGGSVSVGFLVAVFVSNVPEGLAATSDMKAHTSPARLYRMWLAIAVVSAIAGGLGYAGARWLPGADGREIQAFAGGAVLTMLSSSMVPEAYEDGGRRVALFTALGFAIAAILTTLD